MKPVLGRLMCRQEDNIKIDMKEKWLEIVYWLRTGTIGELLRTQ
jgi:hypothetical protein